MPPGWTSPATTISRRSSDTRWSPSVMSPYGLDEKQRLFDRAMKEYSGLKYIDTHCHLDLMYNNMHKFDKYSAWRQKYKGTYPPTYEGCIPDWCDPSIFDVGASDWWKTVMEVGARRLRQHTMHLLNFHPKKLIYPRSAYICRKF